MKLRRLLLLLFPIFITAIGHIQPVSGSTRLAIRTQQSSQILAEELLVGPADFSKHRAKALVLLPGGLSSEPNYPEGVYTSLPAKAPLPFNALTQQWKVDLPEGSDFHLEMRTGRDPSNLGDWVAVEESADMTSLGDDMAASMLVVPAEDVTHEFFQYRISMSHQQKQSTPQLHEMHFTFIDSTAGPTVEEMIAQQKERDLLHNSAQTLDSADTDGYPKPFVVSREVWCTHPDCDYSEGLRYYPVTHLILHHTTGNAANHADSAAFMRAIWYSHTYINDWGDVGYNYLVDSEGVLFEGHAGGDDVVGIHARGANTGTMALSMLGTFSTVEPPPKMLDSIAGLFAWKADQKGIDVFDASDTLPYINYGLPNLMGHRDVYGDTQCPGAVAHTLLPAIRKEVASRIGFESPHIYVDELSQSFRKSSANWYDGPMQCGFNAHSWYTYSTINPSDSTNWGEWRPEISESGLYEIEVYTPFCNTGKRETSGASYSIEHADGMSTAVVDQDDRLGLWTSIGSYNLRSGNNNVVRLGDITATDSWLPIWFDAVRLRPLESFPSAAAGLPSAESWLSDRSVTFTWQIDNQEKVKKTTLQVATDEQFEDRILDQVWPAPVFSSTAELNQDYAALFWRVIVTTESGNEYPSAVIRFGLDSTPPSSSVTRLFWLKQDGYYKVFWGGQDEIAGVDTYNLDYRQEGSGQEGWQSWLHNVTETSAFFAPPDHSAVYEFRSQATDKLGNQELPASAPDINTDLADRFNHAILLPMLVSK